MINVFFPMESTLATIWTGTPVSVITGGWTPTPDPDRFSDPSFVVIFIFASCNPAAVGVNRTVNCAETPGFRLSGMETSVNFLLSEVNLKDFRVDNPALYIMIDASPVLLRNTDLEARIPILDVNVPF